MKTTTAAAATELPADPNEEDFTKRLEKRQMLDALTGAVKGLPEREWLIVSLYYRDEMTMKEIAQILDISESRVCQLHGRALSRLRSRLAARPAAQPEGGRPMNDAIALLAISQMVCLGAMIYLYSQVHRCGSSRPRAAPRLRARAAMAARVDVAARSHATQAARQAYGAPMPPAASVRAPRARRRHRRSHERARHRCARPRAPHAEERRRGSPAPAARRAGREMASAARAVSSSPPLGIGALALLAAFGQAGGARANGVPQLVKLTYLNGVSNWGPQGRRGRARIQLRRGVRASGCEEPEAHRPATATKAGSRAARASPSCRDDHPRRRRRGRARNEARQARPLRLRHVHDRRPHSRVSGGQLPTTVRLPAASPSSRT